MKYQITYLVIFIVLVMAEVMLGGKLTLESGTRIAALTFVVTLLGALGDIVEELKIINKK